MESNEKVETQEELKARLSDIEYKVTQEAGTERAFTGKYWDEKADGSYHCIVCDAELFSSDTKFDSGSGWPSFTSPTDEANIVRKTDRTFGMKRTEVLCANCEAHLGHVFNDGPGPEGERHCINSASLGLKPKD